MTASANSFALRTLEGFVGKHEEMRSKHALSAFRGSNLDNKRTYGQVEVGWDEKLV